MERKMMTGRVYSNSFKRMVVEEYLATRSTKKELMQKHGIKYSSAISEWLRQFGLSDKVQQIWPRFVLPPITADPMPPKDSNVEELMKKIKLLERQVEDEKLRAEAYLRMIEYAEKELKISIKKKPGSR
jgi:transposase